MDGLTEEQEVRAAAVAEDLGISLSAAREIVATGAGKGCTHPG